MKHQPQLKVTEADFELISHLFAFENCEPLTDSLVSKLIRLGWKKDTFDAIQKTAPCCEHGAVTAYYSKNRNSILYSGGEDSESIKTVEIEKNNTVHFHGLPRSPELLEIVKNRL